MKITRKETWLHGGALLFLMGIPTLMMVVSVSLMPFDFSPLHSSQTWLTVRHPFAIRQGVAGVVALVLALCVRRVPWRYVLRLGAVFPVAMLIVLILAPLSVWMGCDRMVLGTGWWQRSIGQSVFLLALIFSVSTVMPRVLRREWRGLLSVVGLVVLSVAVPIFFFKMRGMLVVSVAVLSWVLLVSLPFRQWLLILLAPSFVFFFGVARLYLSTNRGGRSFSFNTSESFQLLQAFVSVHAGGLFGNPKYPVWIPEWKNDFIFAHLCGVGGVAVGVLCLIFVAILLTVAWRIVARQTDSQARAVTAGCASVLTALPLLHIAVNLGLLPTMAIHFPFLSYGPTLVVFEGLLVGLLLAFGRTNKCGPQEGDAGVPTRSYSRWMPAVVMGGVLLALVCFGIRLGVLVFDSPYLHEVHQANVSRFENRLTHRKQQERGQIFDSSDRVLAKTGQMQIACADAYLCATTSDPQMLPKFARLIGLDEQAVRDCLSDTSRRNVRIKKGISVETAEAVRRLGFRAFFINTVPVRDYPFDAPLVHLVGCTGSAEDYRGLSGAEVAYNTLLHEGGDVKLTLDIDLQASLQKLVEGVVSETHAQQAQVVVMDARTGAIRAAAQLPALSGDEARGDNLDALRWLATGAVFEPGGLLKPLIVAAALEKGVITPESRLNCEQGLWTYEGLPMHDPSSEGELTPAEILQKSSNIGMAKIGLLLGGGPLYEAVVGWGLNQKCAGGLNFSESGILHGTKRWSKIEVTRLPIGHGCAVTLLQLLRAYSALFNDGRMIEPSLIAATRPAADADWEPVPVTEPRSVIRPETAAWLQTTLKKDLADGLSVIGQAARVNKPLQSDSGYDPDRIQTSFMGSVDIGGTPQLIAVWLDEPVRDGTPNSAIRFFESAVLLVEGMK